MNTPAHLAASTFMWRNEAGWKSASAIAIGAVLPDAPMFVFYAYQKLFASSSEQAIWSTLYFEDDWQWFFDLFNSIPLLLAVLLVSRFAGFRGGALLAASALLHVVLDLPLHHDDAHRHFLPFSHWRFASPVSYWDPNHYGLVFALLELIFALTACIYVAWRGPQRPMRLLAVFTLLIYAGGILFAVVVWLPQLSVVTQPP